MLGNFHRPGQTFTQQTVETYDHDFGRAGQGKLIPHGVYDLANNHAHLTRACRGLILHTVDIAKQFPARAKTRTGLRVTVSLLNKIYATGRKYAQGFNEKLKIIFDAPCRSGTTKSYLKLGKPGSHPEPNPKTACLHAASPHASVSFRYCS